MTPQPATSYGPSADGPGLRTRHPAASAADAPAPMPLWKRSLDLACVLLTAPLWLPLMVLITVWIKLASRGPVFFQQERIGFQARRFMILKFRSMKVNAETDIHARHFEQLMASDGPMTKMDGADPRIIPGGRLLRATGLDELPQLFNVLAGTMSLVGPRPCLPHEYDRYVGRQRERVKAPPGLTGHWQVNGKNKTTFSRMIELDLFYAEHMSLWLDLWIMARTVPALVAQSLAARAGASHAVPLGSPPSVPPRGGVSL